MISKCARPNNDQLGLVITSLYSLLRSCKWPCVSSVFWEHHRHVIYKQMLSFSTHHHPDHPPLLHHPHLQPAPPPATIVQPPPTTLHTPMTTIAWQWHITSPLAHTISDDIQWRRHTVSNDIWWRQWQCMSSLLSTLLKVSNLTLSPLPSFHMRSRCHIANSDVATNNERVITNDRQPGKPSDCSPPLISSNQKQVSHCHHQHGNQQQSHLITLPSSFYTWEAGPWPWKQTTTSCSE